MLQLEAVSKFYRDTAETVRAVRDVSLSVNSGEMVGLLGPSGSGKTTLLLLAAGLLPADGGRIRVDNRDLAQLTPREATDFRLHRIGFVFQSFQLLPGMSAIDNVALPLMLAGLSRRAARRQVAGLVDRVGLGPRAQHLPTQLSGGERQRVALAKALACEPSLLLADEPTGNLDSQRTHEVLKLLAETTHERRVATLVVSHDPEAERYTDRSYHLRDGELLDAPPRGSNTGSTAQPFAQRIELAAQRWERP